jgi:hypothetical protein
MCFLTNEIKEFTMQALLPRFNPQANNAVVFITDTEDKGPKKELQAWFPNGDGIRVVPIEFYKSTLQLNEEETKQVVDDYAKHNNAVAYCIRHRLPYSKSKNIPQRLQEQAANEAQHKPVEQVRQETQVVENINVKPLSARQKAARQRYQEDLVKSSMKDVKSASPEDKKRAAEELAAKIAQMLLTTLED